MLIDRWNIALYCKYYVIWYGVPIKDIFFCFTLYLAYSKVDKEKHVLKHSVHIMTLQFFTLKFWRHCVLSGRTQRCALSRYSLLDRQKRKIQNILFSRGAIEPITSCVYSHKLCTCAMTDFQICLSKSGIGSLPPKLMHLHNAYLVYK